MWINIKYIFWNHINLLTYLWVFKLEDVEKPFEQTSQMWGFSPVWVRKCLFNRLGRSNILPQTRQGSIVLVLFLLPLMLLHSISFLRFPADLISSVVFNLWNKKIISFSSYEQPIRIPNFYNEFFVYLLFEYFY